MSCWQDKIDGTLHSVNQTYTNWNDIRVSATSTKLGGSKDPTFSKIFDNGSGSQGVFTYVFSNTTEEEVYFAVQLPHNWKEGTALSPHVHWIGQTNGGAGQDVCWALEYSIATIGSTFGNTTIIHGDTNHLSETIVANKHYLTELTDITMTGNKISTMLICRLFRDATDSVGVDDYPNDVALLEFDIHYQIDSLGSQTEYTKVG